LNCSHVFSFYLMMPSVQRIIASMAYKWTLMLMLENPNTRRETCNSANLSTKNSNGLACYQTLTSKMRGLKLTIWTIVWP
jgi:hypothetical protein